MAMNLFGTCGLQNNIDFDTFFCFEVLIIIADRVILGREGLEADKE